MPKKIKLEVPKTYVEINPEVWEELEKLIFTGFLHSPVSLFDINFVFKTLNYNEIKMIEFMKPNKRASERSRNLFKAQFISYSIFLVNGENMIYDRSSKIGKLIKIVQKIPNNVLDKIISHLNDLNSRVNRVFPLVEVYPYEDRSRFRWMQTKQSPVNDTRNTGIPGTENLGMNSCQSTWTAMNNIIDSKDAIEREWSNAKFVGSCFSKGVKNVDDRDRARIKRDKREVEEKKHKLLHAYLNTDDDGSYIPPDELVTLPDGRRAVVDSRFKAETAEELADQLSKALSGEKDWHDLIIEHHQKVMEEKKREHEMGSYKLLPSSTGEFGTRVLSKDEADEYVKRVNSMRLNNFQRFNSPPDFTPPDSLFGFLIHRYKLKWPIKQILAYQSE